MIDFANKTETMLFAVTAALAVVALACVIVLSVRKRAGLFGIAFYILAWIVVLPATAMMLTALLGRFSLFGISVTVSGSEVIFAKNAAQLFVLPYVGGFVGVMLKRIMLEIAVYALFAVTVAALIALPVKWHNRVDISKYDGDGYFSVSEELERRAAEEQAALETKAEAEKTEEGTDNPVAEESAESESAEEITVEAPAEEAIEEEAEAPAEEIIPEVEAEDEATAEAEIEPDETETAEDKPIDEKKEGGVDFSTVKLTPKTVERRKRNAKLTAKVEPVASVVLEPTKEDGKRKKRVTGTASEVFGEYLKGKSDEDKSKLFASIDVVNPSKKDE